QQHTDRIPYPVDFAGPFSYEHVTLVIIYIVIIIHVTDPDKPLDGVFKSDEHPERSDVGYYAVEYLTDPLLHIFDLLQVLSLPLRFIRGPLPLGAFPRYFRYHLRQFLFPLFGKSAFQLLLYEPVYDQVRVPADWRR